MVTKISINMNVIVEPFALLPLAVSGTVSSLIVMVNKMCLFVLWYIFYVKLRGQLL